MCKNVRSMYNNDKANVSSELKNCQEIKDELSNNLFHANLKINEFEIKLIIIIIKMLV